MTLSSLVALSLFTGCAMHKSSAAPASAEMAAMDGGAYGGDSAEPGGGYAAGGESYAEAADDGASYEEAPAAPPAGASEDAAGVSSEAMAEPSDMPAPSEPAPVTASESDSAPVLEVTPGVAKSKGRASRSRKRVRKTSGAKPLARAKTKKVRKRPAKPRPKPDPEPEFDNSIQAGQLTAGAFDDTLNPAVLGRFAKRMGQSQVTAEVANLVDGPMTVVRVVDSRGAPIHDAEVRLDGDERGGRVPTGTDGRAVFFSGWDLSDEQQRRNGLTAVVRHGRESVSARVTEGDSITITMPRTRAHSVSAVDIALVIDATGSMSDELEYLKVELRNIARTVDRAFPQVDQRYALVVYRDEGDDYVSRSFNFTTNLSRFEKDLGRQSAGGGGDYPEAMHSALHDAADLSWDDDAAKLVFLVADAPPHGRHMRSTMEAVDDLRMQGVGFYPVAASGVAAEAEIVMRAAAAASGGQYLFLTNDSGVGNSHAEPHIPCYEVQSLRDIMIRMLHAELAGERITADPQRTVRSVGRSNDGVCETLARAR